MTARTEYENRRQARQRLLEQLRRKDDHAVSFRTAMFCVGLLIAWAVLGGWGAAWQFLLIPGGLFLAGLFYHESVKRKQRSAKLAIDYYERCLQRLDGEWAGVGPDGGEFLDPLHPYAGDLDIFGVGSVFQLLNSPITPGGAKTLAMWLAPAPGQGLPSGGAVVNRQNAVRTLCDQIDLRERTAGGDRLDQAVSEGCRATSKLAQQPGWADGNLDSCCWCDSRCFGNRWACFLVPLKFSVGADSHRLRSACLSLSTTRAAHRDQAAQRTCCFRAASYRTSGHCPRSRCR